MLLRFQFQMVRLKAFYRLRRVGFSSLFQFQMVRLKAYAGLDYVQVPICFNSKWYD